MADEAFEKALERNEKYIIYCDKLTMQQSQKWYRHIHITQLKTSIIKVVGTAQYEENSNRYSIPIELYSLQKQFLGNAYLSVKESDPPFEEVTNF